jgi:hypothetical protein
MNDTSIPSHRCVTAQDGVPFLRHRIAAAVAAVVAVAALTGCGGTNSKAASDTSQPGSILSADMSGVKKIKVNSADHVQTAVEYAQTPPVGGDHNPGWQNCGAYAEPVPNELGVHSMEHGAVWITYQPDLAPDKIEALRGLASGRTHLLVSPYNELGSPIVLSAWGLQLTAESADDPRIAQFISTYEQGPQSPEPGAPCSGAIGNPL